jgi:hypothetical protein
MARKKMPDAARYALDCLGYFVEGKPSGEPLGAPYGLDRPTAVAIADGVYERLQRAGVKTNPRWVPVSPGYEDRVIAAYHKRGLAA